MLEALHSPEPQPKNGFDLLVYTELELEAATLVVVVY